jgi:hypothetical protein
MIIAVPDRRVPTQPSDQQPQVEQDSPGVQQHRPPRCIGQQLQIGSQLDLGWVGMPRP